MAVTSLMGFMQQDHANVAAHTVETVQYLYAMHPELSLGRGARLDSTCIYVSITYYNLNMFQF